MNTERFGAGSVIAFGVYYSIGAAVHEEWGMTAVGAFWTLFGALWWRTTSTGEKKDGD